MKEESHFAAPVCAHILELEIGCVFNRVISSVAPIVGVLIGFLLIENRTQLYLVFSVKKIGRINSLFSLMHSP